MGNLDLLRMQLEHAIDENNSGAIDLDEFRDWYVSAVDDMEVFKMEQESRHRDRLLLSSRKQVGLTCTVLCVTTDAGESRLCELTSPYCSVASVCCRWRTCMTSSNESITMTHIISFAHRRCVSICFS